MDARALKKKNLTGNSLAVQWLGLGTFTAGAQVQSLIGELRSTNLVVRPKKKKDLAVVNQSLVIPCASSTFFLGFYV